jgi:hypothetical protein
MAATSVTRSPSPTSQKASAPQLRDESMYEGAQLRQAAKGEQVGPAQLEFIRQAGGAETRGA